MVLALAAQIIASPATRGGKPCIAGTRIAVHDIALNYLRLGLSLEQVAARYDLPMAAAHAAMAYYYEHREQIEAEIDAEHDAIERAALGPSSLVRQRTSPVNDG